MGMSLVIGNADFSQENLGKVSPIGKRWFIDQSQNDLNVLADQQKLGSNLSVVFSGDNTAYNQRLSGRTIYRLMIGLTPKTISQSTTISIGTISNATPPSISWEADVQTINIGAHADASLGIYDARFVLVNLLEPLYVASGKYLQFRCNTDSLVCGSEKVSSLLSDYAKTFKSPYICGGSFNKYFNNWVTLIRFYGE